MQTQRDCQAEVLAFLEDPASHRGREVRRIDTHASSVFLVGERALKIKRAVRFPFLDYSSLDKRKAACAAELEVNRPFAPELYRRIVPVTREASGRLALDGEGEPVEWAVEMRRFDEASTLDRLADAGRIDIALADTLGRVVAAAHARAPVVSAARWIAALDTYLDQNEAAFREFPHLFAAEAIAELQRNSRRALARVRPLLLARGKLGLIRRGHGDLHLGNIALIDGRPVPFDAIEFSELVASGDVLYDLAFLLMDLIERGLLAAANAVLNRYLAESSRESDLDALAALPLFLSLRAAIRAKVTAARLHAADTDPSGEIARAAQAYFRLADKLLESATPMLIAVGGLSGSGKSLLARALAPELMPAPGAVVLRSDVERKTLFGEKETERLPVHAYAPEITARVYAVLAGKARRVVGAGHCAVVDAVFADPAERAAIRAAANGIGAEFRGLFLVAPLPIRLERIGARSKDASDADAPIARRQESSALGEMDFTEIDASGTPAETLARAKAALSGSPAG
jgi:aminoglycoside phosphotransferase family enzyme/predicted kinase